MIDDDLAEREALRRKGLWTLAHLVPGDPAAIPVIDVLDDIDRRDQLVNLVTPTVIELMAQVQVHAKPTGYQIVRELDIPQPWRERFLRASVGSTRALEGFYVQDWNSFIQRWQAEMRHLQAHRNALTAKRGL